MVEKTAVVDRGIRGPDFIWYEKLQKATGQNNANELQYLKAFNLTTRDKTPGTARHKQSYYKIYNTRIEAK